MVRSIDSAIFGVGRNHLAARPVMALMLAFASAACRPSSDARAARTDSTNADSASAAVLATVGGERITLGDVRREVGDELDQLATRYQQDRYKLTNAALQGMVRDRVLREAAKEQGRTIDEMLLTEAGSIEPSDADVAGWYQANKERLGGQSLDDLRSRIVEFLRTERKRAAAVKVEDRFIKAGKLAIHLEPYRVPLRNDGAPSIGPANSPVTLVEFSDFQCPFCRGFVPTLKRIEDAYRNRVRIVYRQYPIPSLHPFAQKAAEASLCANEAGKFWEMHDLLFQEQDRLSVDDLKAKAARLGIDRPKFDACLDSGRLASRVAEDVREGTRAGVTGTPALFVNGVVVEGGAVGFDAVARALDAELARVKR
jgi:protein-disulfide isomerase